MYILFIPEEGWFGQPKYSTFLKKVILRCIGLCFNYHQKIAPPSLRNNHLHVLAQRKSTWHSICVVTVAFTKVL